MINILDFLLTLSFKGNKMHKQKPIIINYVYFNLDQGLTKKS